MLIYILIALAVIVLIRHRAAIAALVSPQPPPAATVTTAPDPAPVAPIAPTVPGVAPAPADMLHSLAFEYKRKRALDKERDDVTNILDGLVKFAGGPDPKAPAAP